MAATTHTTSRRSRISAGALSAAVLFLGAPRAEAQGISPALRIAIAAFKAKDAEIVEVIVLRDTAEAWASNNEPAIPPELFEPIQTQRGLETPFKPEEGWSLHDLIGIERCPVYVGVPVPEATQAHARRLQAVKKAHTAAVAAHWREYNELVDRHEKLLGQISELTNQISACPSHSVADLLAKCELLETEQWHAKGCTAADGLISDIRRLAAKGLLT